VGSLFTRTLRSSLLGIVALGALIFVPAGTFRYWQGWAYAAVFIGASAAFTVYLAVHDPALLERRMQAGPAHEREPAQKAIVASATFGFLSLIVLPALDHRFGWSRVPWYVSVAGDLLVAVGFYVFYLVARVNSFAAANIRVEQGQTVVSTGPYAVVRHPMYAGAFLLLVGTPLALGSWRGLLVVPAFVLILVLRILNEERVLLRDLPGYSEYRQAVRYRLVPSIW
jgi:protein-S-isoprenylcysteine O-methyltransferase Ste14